MGRTILHSNMNSFYASVKCPYHPEVQDKPVAVAGDGEARHGIILWRSGTGEFALYPIYAQENV